MCSDTAMVPGVLPPAMGNAVSQVPPSLVIDFAVTLVPLGVLSSPMFWAAGRLVSPCT